MLDVMRKKYDAEFEAWKDGAVPYNDYQKYGVLFDRAIPWQRKKFGKEKLASKKPGRAAAKAAQKTE